MKLCVTIFCVILASGVRAFPTRLTEEQFLSATSDDDAIPVDIVSGYAQIRRQGRNFGASGDKVKFSNKPVTVKDPSQFVAPSDSRRPTFDEEKAPIFSLEKMIQEEAEKLKNQVEVASLMAAHAAEEAAAHIKAAAAAAANKAEIEIEEVDKIIENAVDSGIREAEEIVQTEVEEVKQEEEAAVTEKAAAADDVINVDEAEKSSAEKVEDLTSEKPANVEWSADDLPPQEPAEETEVEVKEVPVVEEVVTEKIEEDKPQELESLLKVEDENEIDATESAPKVEEVAANSTELPDENKTEESEDGDESSRVQTTETAHPPQDVDLGSVQEV